jgi:hypothetical protein
MTTCVAQHEFLRATLLKQRSSFALQGITRSGPLRNSETRNNRTVLHFDMNGSQSE